VERADIQAQLDQLIKVLAVAVIKNQVAQAL
jgi:hypothetical protein